MFNSHEFQNFIANLGRYLPLSAPPQETRSGGGGAAVRVHHSENSPLRMGEQAHFMHPAGVETDPDQVVGVGRADALPLGVPAPLDAHGLALQGDPPVVGEVGAAISSSSSWPVSQPRRCIPRRIRPRRYGPGPSGSGSVRWAGPTPPGMVA